MSRPQSARLALVLLLAVVPAAHAQLGGLKKKVVDKVTGKDTVAAAGTGKAKCDASSMVVTGDVIDRYLKSLAARDAGVQRLAKEPGKTGAYYSALLKRQAIENRKREYDLRRGPDWEKNKAIHKRMVSGDTAAFRESRDLSEALNPSRVQIPELEWESQMKGNARIDSTMMAAGGFSECDWRDLGERVPRMVSLLATDPKARDLQGLGTEKDAAVIRARLPELKSALGYTETSPEDEARIKAEDAALAEEVARPRSTGDPQTDCIAQVQQEWAKTHKAELEAAQEKGDMNALTALSMQMNAAVMKCVSQ